MADPIVQLDPDSALWDRVFTIAPLVLVGTREPNGEYDLAPKHLAFPVGWGPFFAFVCTPRHATYHNVLATDTFTVSYPRPEQVVVTGQAAAPRVGEAKPSLLSLPTRPATHVDGVLLEGASLWLECVRERIIDDIGEHSIVVGRVVHATAPESVLRGSDRDDADTIYSSPLLTFVSPGRFAVVDDTRSFPFPLDFHR